MVDMFIEKQTFILIGIFIGVVLTIGIIVSLVGIMLIEKLKSKKKQREDIRVMGIEAFVIIMAFCMLVIVVNNSMLFITALDNSKRERYNNQDVFDDSDVIGKTTEYVKEKHGEFDSYDANNGIAKYYLGGHKELVYSMYFDSKEEIYKVCVNSYRN